MLGRQPNNNKSIEVQIMCRFVRESQLMHYQLPSHFEENFSPIYPLSGTVAFQIDVCSTLSLTHWKQITTVNLNSTDWTIDLNYFRLHTASRQCVLTPDEQTLSETNI